MSIHIQYPLLFVGITFAFQCALIDGSIIRRAAYDLGSGLFKLQIADVDTITNTIVKSLYTDTHRVKLGNDLAESKDGMLSSIAQERALNSMKIFCRVAEEHGVTQSSGVATAVFRKAKNGAALLKCLADIAKTTLVVLTQQEEGDLGFKTGQALSKNVPNGSLIVWDSGNASFQISDSVGNVTRVFEGPTGNTPVTKLFMETIRKKPYNKNDPINPVTKKEIDTLSMVLEHSLPSCDWLVEKLTCSDTQVVGIGDPASIFALASNAVGKKTVTKREVFNELEKRLNLENDNPLLTTLDPADTNQVLMRLTLLYTVMKRYGINSFTFAPTPTGNTPGILIQKQFWK